MDVVSLKILAGLVTVLGLKGEYGSMLRDSSTFDVFVRNALPKVGWRGLRTLGKNKYEYNLKFCNAQFHIRV